MSVLCGDAIHSGDVNTAGRYNPATDSWTATTTIAAPTPSEDHTAVWTGKEMIIFGGSYTDFDQHTAAKRYCAATKSTWVALGDSYSSGEGAGSVNYISGTDVAGQNLCHRSNTAYPRAVRE